MPFAMDTLNDDLIEHILSHLSRREALQTALVCSAWAVLIKKLDSSQHSRPWAPRILVGCSRLCRVLDVDPATGAATAAGRWGPRARPRSVASGIPRWLTGMAVSPYNGDVYACQARQSIPLQHRNSLKNTYNHITRYQSTAHPGCPT